MHHDVAENRVCIKDSFWNSFFLFLLFKSFSLTKSYHIFTIGEYAFWFLRLIGCKIKYVFAVGMRMSYVAARQPTTELRAKSGDFVIQNLKGMPFDG